MRISLPRPLRLGLCAALAAAACGVDPTAGAVAGAPGAARAALGSDDADVCAEIERTLDHQRERLAGTGPWQALAATPAWQAVRADLQESERLHCRPFDSTASEACRLWQKRLEGDFNVLNRTEAYRTAAASPAWQAVAATYRAKREHNCWEGQQEPAVMLP